MPRILFVDHQDSFSNNIVAVCRGVVETVVVQSKDASAAFEGSKFDGVMLSPGPGHPRDYPDTLKLCQRLRVEKIPTFGICLGHQMLLYECGFAVVANLDFPVHGRRETLQKTVFSHFSQASFEGQIVLYNSLEILASDSCFPKGEWRLLATLGQSVMAVEAESRPHTGVQFHPESFACPNGESLIEAFCKFC